MNYLVLGGAGFIGSHVVDYLLQKGHNVTVLDTFYERFRNPLNNVKYYIGSFSDEKLIEKSLENQDIVIHLISTTIPETSNLDIINDVQSNLYPTLYLFKKASESNIKKIIYISSGGAVYGNPKIIPIMV